MMRRLGFASLAFCLAAVSAFAQMPPPQRPILPGIGQSDARAPVNPELAPWRGMGKLQTNSGNLHTSCTGMLIGPRLVLTAAHCLFNPRTQSYFRPVQMHFLLGYTRGAFAAHAQGSGISIAPGYDPKQPIVTLGSDWALLALDKQVGTPDRVVGFATQPPHPGQAVMLGGYSRDFGELITADSDCRVLNLFVDSSGHHLIRHNCAATYGASGAPLLVREGQSWKILGIEDTAGKETVGGLAVSIGEVIQSLTGQKPNM